MALYALILAGGASSRFWPLSGDDQPKYLLRPDGTRSLIELAYERALACTPAANILVVTGKAQAAALARALPGLPAANICMEPSRRDTAAAIALGCKVIGQRDSGADVLVLPADTLIEPQKALATALARAQSVPDYAGAIHVFGVRPTRPEGAFGYIEPGAQVAPGVHSVASFVEKPGPRAADFVQRGALWNAGCFFFRLDTFMRELAAHLPQLSDRLRGMTGGGISAEDYNALQSISIDYGLIEKAHNLRVAMLEAAFDDIGTWDALALRGGLSQGGLVNVDGTGNLAFAPGRTVAVVGESDLMVIADGDRILVLKRGHGQKVKQAAQQAERKPNA